MNKVVKFIIFFGLSTNLLAAHVYPKPPEMTSCYYPPEFRIVSNIHVGGSKITLDDGSVWSIKSTPNQIIVGKWERGDIVHFSIGFVGACGNYMFRNNRTRTEVPMEPLTCPDPTNSATYTIAQFSYLRNRVVLESSSGASLTYVLSSAFHRWREGDCISIGSGAIDKDFCGLRNLTSFLYNWRSQTGLPAYLE